MKPFTTLRSSSTSHTMFNNSPIFLSVFLNSFN